MPTLTLNRTNGSIDLEAFVHNVGLTIEASIATHQRLLACETTVALIASVAETIVKSMRQGGKLLLFGNGGSAADAQHIAAEFVGRFGIEHGALPVPRCR